MAYVNLNDLAFEAFTHINKKEFKAAEEKLSYLLNLNPDDAVLIYYLGCLFLEQKRYGFAICAYNRALELAPDFHECLNNISTAYRQAGCIEKCIENFTKAIAIISAPDCKDKDKDLKATNCNLADYLANLGSCYIGRGTPLKALEYFEKSLAIWPECMNAKWNQALAYLELGNWIDGFTGYDFGERVSPAKERSYHGGPLSTPVWQGPGTFVLTDNKPTVVVYGEQGIGDEIMFASIIPDMMEHANVILECHPRLMQIFRMAWPSLTIYGTRKATQVTWAKGLQIDSKIAIGSLAKHFRKNTSDFPGTSYLRANPRCEQLMADKCQSLDVDGRKPKIGISWKGGISITNKLPRCIPLETLKPLFALDADFISLQYHVNAQHEVDVFNESMGETIINHWQDVVDDYDLTAGLLENLDLVISVPQSIVHLAGAMGVNTIQLCPKQGLWQMGVYGQNAPWYESVQNFWQPVDGDWKTVVANVVNLLGCEGYKARC